MKVFRQQISALVKTSEKQLASKANFSTFLQLLWSIFRLKLCERRKVTKYYENDCGSRTRAQSPNTRYLLIRETFENINFCEPAENVFREPCSGVYCKLWIYFRYCSVVSIVDLEQVHAGWHNNIRIFNILKGHINFANNLSISSCFQEHDWFSSSFFLFFGNVDLRLIKVTLLI